MVSLNFDISYMFNSSFTLTGFGRKMYTDYEIVCKVCSASYTDRLHVL